MKKFILSLLFFILFAGIVFAGDWTPIKDRTLYTGETDRPINTAWDSTNSRHHNVQVWIPYRDDADTEVEYEIYDGDTLKYTAIIDHSLDKYRGRWVTITKVALPILSGELKIVMTANDSTKYAIVDAVRLSYSPCEVPENGIIKIIGEEGTSSTGLWSITDTSSGDHYSSTLPRISNNGTYTWEFSNVATPITDISYDAYIRHFPSNTIYAFSNTSKCGLPIMIPKTGHYSFYARTLKDCFENTELDGKTFEELVALVNEADSKWVGALFYLEHGFVIDADGLRFKMLGACWASTWVTSIIAEQAMVDCEHKAWWIYGYPAPPGPIGF